MFERPDNQNDIWCIYVDVTIPIFCMFYALPVGSLVNFLYRILYIVDSVHSLMTDLDPKFSLVSPLAPSRINFSHLRNGIKFFTCVWFRCIRVWCATLSAYTGRTMPTIQTNSWDPPFQVLLAQHMLSQRPYVYCAMGDMCWWRPLSMVRVTKPFACLPVLIGKVEAYVCLRLQASHFTALLERMGSVLGPICMQVDIKQNCHDLYVLYITTY